MVLVGIGYGLFRGLRAFGGVAAQASRVHDMETRLEGVEQAIARLSGANRPPWSTERSDWVDRRELAEAIDRATARIDRQLEARFEKQSRAIGSLRAMIGQTDILLERVLDGLATARPAIGDMEERGEEIRT